METNKALKIVTHNGEALVTFKSETERKKIIAEMKHAHRIEEGTLTGNLFVATPKNKKVSKKKTAKSVEAKVEVGTDGAE